MWRGYTIACGSVPAEVMDNSERRVYLLWLLVLSIGCAVLWTVTEGRLERERALLIKEAEKTAGLVEKAVATFFKNESDRAVEALRNEAGTAAERGGSKIPAGMGKLDEETKRRINAAYDAEARRDAGIFICDPKGRVEYAWVSPEDMAAVRTISAKLSEKPEGVLKLNVPPPGRFYIYASVEREGRLFCVFMPAQGVTGLVGGGYRKGAKAKAREMFDSLPEDGRYGTAYLVEGKLVAGEDFPLTAEEAKGLPAGKLTRVPVSFLREVYVYRRPFARALKLSGIFYMEQPSGAAVLLFLLAILAGAALVSLPAFRFAWSRKRKGLEALAARLTEECESPRAIFGRDGRFLAASPAFHEVLESAGMEGMPAELEEAAERFAAGEAEVEEVELGGPEGRTLTATLYRVEGFPAAKLAFPLNKRSETEYVLITRYWNELMDGLEAGVATFGKEGSLKSFNRTMLEILDIEDEAAAELETATVERLFEMSPLEGPFELIEEAVREGKTLSGEEIVLVGPGAQKRTVFAWTTGMKTEWLSFSLLALVEVRKVERLEERLREAERELEETKRTLSVVTHEVRNALQAFLYRTLEEHEGDDSRLVRRLKLLAALLNDILEFTKLDSKRLLPNRVSFSPGDLALDLAHVFGEQAEAKGLQFRLELSPDLPERVTGDPSRISEILINIVSNALKYVDSGTITLEVEYSKPSLIFRVRDTGIGLHPKQQERLFDEFFRAGDPGMSPTKGTGIGLTITRKLIELLGGKIALTSSPGKGTTFTISVPVEEEATEGESPEDRRNVSLLASRLKGLDRAPRLLVVDDDPASLSYYRVALSKAGADFELAASATEAMDRLAAEDFDILITDDQMPEVTGTELAEAVREMKGNRIFIMLLTGLAREEITRPELFDAIITKPVDFSFWKVFSLAGKGLFPVKEAADGCPIDDHFLNFLDDPELLELLMDYLKVLGETAGRLRKLLDEGKREELAAELHAVKGTAASYGLADISALARKVETALHEGAGEEELHPLFDAFVAEYERIKKWLEGYLRSKESPKGAEEE